VNLIYIDPPFDSGADYVRRVSPRGGGGSTRLNGEAYTFGEQIQYSDIWANDTYLQFMYERLLMMKELLHDNGSIVLHADSTRGHQLRCVLDEVFGPAGFRNEITWHYVKYQMGNIKQFVDNTDRLYWYSKSAEWSYNRQMEVLDKPKELLAKGWDKEKKVIVNLRNADGKTYKIQINEEKVDDFWELPFEGPLTVVDGDTKQRFVLNRLPADNTWLLPYIAAPSYERTGFPTQKPEILLDRIVKALSHPGDLVLDAFLGAGTTAVVCQRLGRRWIGCDINKGAIRTAVKRLRGIIAEQIQTARKAAAEARQGTLMDTATEGETPPPKPCAFGFTVWRVNDYDLQIQHNEAVNLACEHIGIERTRSDSFFEGTLGKKLVKIIPFGHPLTPLDLEELKRELDSRPDEDRNVVVVCLGMELAAKAWIYDWNRLRKGKNAVNKIDVIELRTDPKYGKFIKHEPASARVKVTRVRRGDESRIVVEIQDFISPTIVERLREQAGLLSPKIDDWRTMVDCIYIDTAYNGSVLNVALADVPERKTDFVDGKYELPAPADETTVAVKIVDMLGEEVLVTQRV
jgi:DNA modification methylase